MQNERNRELEGSSQTDSSLDVRRRGALKGVLAGGAAAGLAAASLPSSWTQPVVQAVMLPAHAQTTTPPEPEIPPDGSFNAPEEAVSAPTGLLKWFVSSAHAQSASCGLTGEACVSLENGMVTVFVGGDCCCYTSSGTLNSAFDAPPVEDCSECNTPSVEVGTPTGTVGSRILVILINGAHEIECVENVGECSCGEV